VISLAYRSGWFEAAGLAPAWHRFIPEADSGHCLILVRAA
jgi:hypothetical protein